MTLPVTPVVPNPGDKPWDQWADDLTAEVDAIRTAVQALAPTAGPVNFVDGIAPDGTGNVTIGYTDVGALPDSYKPPLSDFPVPLVIPVVKDDASGGTGFWPSSWVGRTPVYTGGSSTAGVRPTADPTFTVEWQCRDNVFPPKVSSGTAGMLAGDRQVLVG